MAHESRIPLHVLVCDAEASSRDALVDELRRSDLVSDVATSNSPASAIDHVRHDRINTIFIDALSLGLEESSNFIFRLRSERPEIAFVLFCDQQKVEKSRAIFYRGERRRFSHYFKLDKRTPTSDFRDEVDAVLRACIGEISRVLPEAQITKLQAEAKRLSAPNSPESRKIDEWLAKLDAALADRARAGQRAIDVKKNTVFISYRFEEKEYFAGLSENLKSNGFECVTGSAANTSISKHVIARIRTSEFFLSLSTRGEEKKDGTFAASPWILEEKGVAVAFEKQIVLMVEDGVTDHGGIVGDWQQIRFKSKSFSTAVLDAVKQLKSYSGQG